MLCFFFSFLDVNLCFKTSPHLLQVFRKMLQYSSAVKLQKYLVNEESSPTFHRHWRWSRYWLNLHFWVNSSLRLSHFSVCFEPYFSAWRNCMLPLLGSKCLCVSSTFCCLLLIFQTMQRQAANVEWLKAGNTHRKEFLIDWNNDQVSLSLLKPKGQRAMLLQEQTGIVLSAKNQPAVALLSELVFFLWSLALP